MPASFDDIWQRFSAQLARLCASYAPPGAARDDLLQDVALAVSRALPDFRGECSERTYVLRIAHNCGLRHALSRRRRAVERSVAHEHDLPSPVDEAGPDHIAERRQRAERLATALRSLPLEQQQVLVSAFEGLSHAETAAVLGVSENTVAVRLHRGRAALRKLMGAHDG